MDGDNFQKGNFDETEEIKGWEKFFEGLKRNQAVIVNADGSGSQPIGASSLETKLAESEGAIGLVFSGKITDRIFTLASGAGIENVMGTSVGTVTRKSGVQAYQIGFMPDGDFQKEYGPKRSVLGLRDAISKSRQKHKNAAEKKAVELYKEMNVMNKVIDAIDKGKTVANIDFPAAIRKKRTDSQFSGEVLWSNVIQSLCALLKDEVNTVRIGKNSIGGCCKYASRDSYDGLCRSCGKRYKKDDAEAFSILTLEF